VARRAIAFGLVLVLVLVLATSTAQAVAVPADERGWEVTELQKEKSVTATSVPVRPQPPDPASDAVVKEAATATWPTANAKWGRPERVNPPNRRQTTPVGVNRFQGASSVVDRSRPADTAARRPESTRSDADCGSQAQRSPQWQRHGVEAAYYGTSARSTITSEALR
jgi:hypothetical protein